MNSKTVPAPAETNTADGDDAVLVPVSTEVSGDVKRALITEGKKHDRTLAAQTRFVLRAWKNRLPRASAA